MAIRPSTQEIREAILRVAAQGRPSANSAHRQQFTDVKRGLYDIFGGPSLPQDLQVEILVQWHELVRTGYFAPGSDLDDPSLGHFHFTSRAMKAAEQLSRDPSNPAGFMRHVDENANLSAVARSYLDEGLRCYTSTLFKSAAVMIGCASEALLIELRDKTIARLSELGNKPPKGLADWRAKIVLASMNGLLEGHKKEFEKALRDDFEAYFLAFAQQIRVARNDAGHPSSIEPVTEQGVHATFLIFPILAKLTTELCEWIPLMK